MTNRRLFGIALVMAAFAASVSSVPGQTPTLPARVAASQDVVDQKLRAHRLWGAPLRGLLDFHAYSEEGKREVLEMWAGMPLATAQSLEEVRELVERMPLEASAELSAAQHAALLDTLSGFLGLQLLPPDGGVDRLIAYHRARGGVENVAKTLETYRRLGFKDPRSWSDFRELLTEFWQIAYASGPVWSGIYSEGSLISVRDIESADQLFDFNKYHPLGILRVKRPGGSLFFDPASTLEQTLERDGTATVAEVTFLAGRNSQTLLYKTYPVTMTFHWESSVANWIPGDHQEPNVRARYERVAANGQ